VIARLSSTASTRVTEGSHLDLADVKRDPRRFGKLHVRLESGGSRRWRAWQLALPAGATLCMTLWGITGASFWRDEAATLSAVRRPMPALWRMLEHTDVVHGLYYLIMWPLVRVLGFGELGARLPSAIAMSVAAAGTAAIGRRLLSPRAGVAAGLTFAVLPVTSRYGQEARSYAMVLALAVLASYLLVRVVEADADGAGLRRWLAAYAAVLAVMGWANMISLLIIPAHALTLVWSARSASAQPDGGLPVAGTALAQWRRHAAGWLIAVAAAAAMVLPLVALAWPQRHGTERFLMLTTISSLASVPRALTGSWPVLVPVLALGLAGIAVGGPARTALRRWSVPWLLLPPFLLLGTGLATPVYDPRYIRFCVPALALLAGSGLDAVAARASAWRGNRTRAEAAGQPPVPLRAERADSRAVRAVIAGLAVIALLSLPAQLAYRGPDGHDDDIRQVAQILAGHEHSGDAVVYFWPWWRQISAAYPAAFRHLRDISLASSPAQDGNFTGTQLPVGQIRARLATVRRVWLVEFDRFQPYPALTVSAWKAARQWHASDFVLTLYLHR
jgi:mannosyltransferase